MSAEPPLESGWVAPELRGEFPALRLVYTTVAAGSGRSPPEVRERLRRMADRYTGGKAVHLRQEPVPWAYRVFFRQIGFDPDEHRTAPEEVALERMKHGGFRSHGLLHDALTIAIVETGVPLQALDADRVEGRLGLRLSEGGERLGGEGRALAPGQIVIADELRALAVVFSEIADDHMVGRSATRAIVAAVQVKGVPSVSVEEALWTVAETVGRPA